MNDLLNRNIKDLIDEYPRIVAVLDAYRIGCTTCGVGTCQLRDIVEIHALSEEDERALFQGMAAIVFPGKTVDIPRLPRTTAAAAPRKLSPPLQLLVEEHRHIKQVIAAIGPLAVSLESTLPRKAQTIRQIVDFIRNYADRFHHAKEEDILFKLFDATADIIVTMLTEHEIGRGHVKALLEALDAGDSAKVAEHLCRYGDLLTEHIRKEDEILYPWIDRGLTDKQVGTLFSQFQRIENDFGDRPRTYVAFAENLSVNH